MSWCPLCLRDAIRGFSNTVEIVRFSAGGYDEHGRWKDGQSETLRVTASVQPTKPKEKMELPENRRSSAAITLHSLEKIDTVSVGGKKQPDIVRWIGEEYEIASVEDWTEHGGFYKAIAVKKGQ